jgi:RNA polymerase sigma-70 factor (ECF subfamily)
VEGRPLGDDQHLIERARDGDLNAYEELVTRYQAVASRTAAVVAGDSDADDAVQEAFVKAFHALGSFRAGAPFRPWLLRIVANEARNKRRAGTRRAGLAQRLVTGRPSGDAAPSPEEAALAHERRARLLAAIDELPERQRLVVSCRYLLDLSEAETAGVLGWPAGTVKSRLSRALTTLRATLVEEVTHG